MFDKIKEKLLSKWMVVDPDVSSAKNYIVNSYNAFVEQQIARQNAIEEATKSFGDSIDEFASWIDEQEENTDLTDRLNSLKEELA